MNITKIITPVIAGLMLASCGGGSDNNPATLDANFRDASVVGLGYTAGSRASALTGDNGSLTCEVGRDVDFFIGNLQLGSSACQALIQPHDLVGGIRNGQASINLVRFLNGFDSGVDDQKIIISEAHTEALSANGGSTTITFDLSVGSFKASLPAAVTDIPGFSLISAVSATAHITATTQCAYSGGYVDEIVYGSASDTTRYGVVIQADGSVSVFDKSGSSSTTTVTLIDQTPTFVASLVSGDATNTITVDNVNLLSSDNIMFGGGDGNTQTTTAAFTRIGGDTNAEYRFTGYSLDSTGTVVTVAVFDVGQSPTYTVTGVVHVLANGQESEIKGSVRTASDTIPAGSLSGSVEGEGQNTTFAASSIILTDGTISGGTWTNSFTAPATTGTFTATGCRLN